MSETTIYLVFHSTETVLVPATIQTAQHIFGFGTNDEKAIDMLDNLFKHDVSRSAIVSILTGERLPEFNTDDLATRSERYWFAYDELTPQMQKRVDEVIAAQE